MLPAIDTKTNIADMTFKVRSQIEQNLGDKWKDLLAVVSETNLHFSLSDSEISEVERELYRADGCPARKLLNRWGDRGMTVNQLAMYMDQLKLERSLMLIRDPEDLRITQNPVDVTVDQGKTLRLECKSVGFPYARYIWFRGKVELSGGYDGILTINSVGHQQRIHAHVNTFRMEDAGPYICRVHNILKKYVFSRWCIVTVNRVNYVDLDRESSSRRSDVSSGICIIEQPSPNSITVPINKRIHLTFRVAPDPALTYQWIRGDTWLQGQTSVELKIDKATLKDSGQYKCIIRRGSQEVVTDPVYVTVHSAQISISKNPAIIIHPVDVTTCVDGLAHFRVKARGKAPLHYAWYHNGNVIPGEDHEDIQVSVTGVMSAGTYQCRVTSDLPDCHCLSREAKLEVNTNNVSYTATDKVALIFGQSCYRGNSSPLPAVINDVYAMRKKLEEMQFKVISLVNLDLGEMRNAVSWFCEMLSAGAYGVFYVAGHGFQYQGQHYLVPWDAPEGLRLKDCLCVQEVQKMVLKQSPAVLVMFLDICRKESSTIDQNEPVVRYQSDGNHCIFYSATYGQESYEPAQLGTIRPHQTVIPQQDSNTMCTSIFCRYLLPVIGVNESIIDVFKHVKQAINDSKDYYKFCQKPELQTNSMEQGRSLCDPIYDDDHAAFSRRTEMWESMHLIIPGQGSVPSKLVYLWFDMFHPGLPLSRHIDVTLQNQVVRIMLGCEYLFTNVLCMHVIPPADKLDCVKLFQVDVDTNSVPMVIKPFEVRKMAEGNILLVFQNLQKLDRPLRPHLSMHLGRILGLGMQLGNIVIPELDLGWPLVSQFQQLRELQERPKSAAGHMEPTQHEEDTQDSLDPQD